MNILIPVDFSDSALNTCNYALKLIGDERAKLFLFHIYPNQLIVADSSFPSGIDSDTFISTEYINELRQLAEKNMRDLVKSVKKLIPNDKEKNIIVENMVTGGEPEYEINEICRELKPDLIVMGTRGEGKKGFLEGSMAEKLMSISNIPLIAIPETFGELKSHRIMYAMNYSEYDFSSIETIFKLYRHIKKEIFVIHIEMNENNGEEQEMMDTLQRRLQRAYPEEKISYFVLKEADKSAALRNAAEEYKIDLIAFIAHKTNFFHTLFSRHIHKKDFFKLELPMLALHEK